MQDTKIRGKKHQKVKEWLHGIRSAEFRLDKLKEQLEKLETKRAAFPMPHTQFGENSGGGGSGENKLDAYVEFRDTYRERWFDLTEKIEKLKTKVEAYYDTLELMKDEKWGQLGSQIISLKYWHKVSPDQAIYINRLDCTREKFYKTMSKAMYFIEQALPDLFEAEK